jgi:glycosyltransferase involved in cell wall biosynthesis
MVSPLVTVAICTYNGERYLTATLDSVLAQTYPNMEVVIVDDGSCDSTISIIKQYAEHDSRIRWFSRENAGLPASRNYAFAQAQGEWIAIIDQDDLCYPERLARQVAVATAHPSAGLVFCNTHYIDSEGRNLGNHLSSFNLPDSFIPRKLAANLLLSKGCYVDSEACFIRRTTVNRLGPLDESLRYACDYDYFIRAGFEVDFAYTSDTLAAWRIHAGQETCTNLDRFKEVRSVLMRHFSHSGVFFGTRLAILWKFVKSFAAEVYYKVRNRLGSVAVQE